MVDIIASENARSKIREQHTLWPAGKLNSGPPRVQQFVGSAAAFESVRAQVHTHYLAAAG